MRAPSFLTPFPNAASILSVPLPECNFVGGVALSFFFVPGVVLLKKSDVSQDRLALLDQPPAPVPSPHPCDQVYMTPSMMERVMCAVLKQVCHL